MIDDGDFGWGPAEPSRGAGAITAAALAVATGLYGVSVWLASGLQPLPSLFQSFKGADAVDERR